MLGDYLTVDGQGRLAFRCLWCNQLVYLGPSQPTGLVAGPASWETCSIRSGSAEVAGLLISGIAGGRVWCWRFLVTRAG